MVEWALDKDPGRRGSAAELLAQLVGEEAADAGRATEVLQRVWQAPPLVTACPGQPAAPSRRGRRRRRRRTAAVVAAAIAVCATLARTLLWPEGDDGHGPDKDPTKVRSGPANLHSAYTASSSIRPRPWEPHAGSTPGTPPPTCAC
ncbi:hypothetical protein GCM10010415_43330 [Streptomyces atrovirens]